MRSSVTQRPLLFVSHSASRTGAPMVLLHFLRWLRANTDIDFEVLSGDSGELLPEFQALAQTSVIETPSLAARTVRRLIGSSTWQQGQDRRFQRRFRNRGYGLIYSNTVWATREIRLLAQLGYPVTCHVHELGYALETIAGHEAFAGALPCIQHFIAASTAVREYLTHDWRIPESKVTLVHEFIPVPPEADAVQDGCRAAMRHKLRVSDDEILVGGCGAPEWRKGSDLFVQLALRVKADPDGEKVRFVWIGGRKGTADYLRFEHDLKICGLTGAVRLIEACSNPWDYFSAMDIFALTSREDPFPLVMLEAGMARLPILCFALSGGGPEFVGTDAGLVAPYLDAAALANHVLSLVRSPAARREMGACAAERVRQNHTLDGQARKLLEVINQQLKLVT